MAVRVLVVVQVWHLVYEVSPPFRIRESDQLTVLGVRRFRGYGFMQLIIYTYGSPARAIKTHDRDTGG